MKQLQAMMVTNYFHKKSFRQLFLAIIGAFLFSSLLSAVIIFIIQQNKQLDTWLKLALGTSEHNGFFNTIIEKLLTANSVLFIGLLVIGGFFIWRFTDRFKQIFLTNFLMGQSKLKILFDLLLQMFTLILSAAFLGVIFLMIMQTPLERLVQHFLPEFSTSLATTTSSSISYAANLTNFMDLNFSTFSWIQITFQAILVTIACYTVLLSILIIFLWWNTLRQLKQTGGDLRLD